MWLLQQVIRPTPQSQLVQHSCQCYGLKNVWISNRGGGLFWTKELIFQTIYKSSKIIYTKCLKYQRVWSKYIFGFSHNFFVHINKNSLIQQKIQRTLIPFKNLYLKWFTGHVAPHVSFYTGLEASRTINPHLIVTCIIGFICIISASGQFFYGKYYLNKFHRTRETIEPNMLSI